MYLNIVVGSGFFRVTKLENIQPIITICNIIGIPKVNRNSCQCFAFKNLSIISVNYWDLCYRKYNELFGDITVIPANGLEV
jgi:hypothetical protein